MFDLETVTITITIFPDVFFRDTAKTAARFLVKLLGLLECVVASGVSAASGLLGKAGT